MKLTSVKDFMNEHYVEKINEGDNKIHIDDLTNKNKNIISNYNKLKPEEIKLLDDADKWDIIGDEFVTYKGRQVKATGNANITRGRIVLTAIQKINEAREKSKECSAVLQLMDKDYSYSEALKKVIKDYNIKDKAKLEKELDIYI